MRRVIFSTLPGNVGRVLAMRALQRWCYARSIDMNTITITDERRCSTGCCIIFTLETA